MRLLHLSDVHIQVDYFKQPSGSLGWRRWMAQVEFALLRRSKQYQAAERALQQIVVQALSRSIDHVVLSGDLTGLSMEEEFLAARRALGPLAEDPALLTVIPGNHDRFTPSAFHERLFEKHFHHLLRSDLPEHCSEETFPFVKLVGKEAAVVGLASARLPPVPGLAYGRVGREQLDGLERILGDPRLEGRAVFVAVHHAPLNPAGRPDLLSHRLLDFRELLGMLKGPRFAVLHGHIHHRFWLRAEGQRPHLFCAGSSTCQGDEGYWIIEAKGGEVVSAEMCSLGAEREPLALPAVSALGVQLQIR